MYTTSKQGEAQPIRNMDVMAEEKGLAIDGEAALSTHINPSGRTGISGDTVATATMVRCSELKMSLSMRFRWKTGFGAAQELGVEEVNILEQNPQDDDDYDESRLQQQQQRQEGEEWVLSFGILWCPEDQSWVGHIGEQANSWGIIHRESATTTESFIGSRGNHFFTIDPIKITNHFEAGDEVRLDVNFKKSAASLVINDVFLHEFPLIVTVPDDIDVSAVVIEDFLLGCVFPQNVEVQIVSKRVAVKDSRKQHGKKDNKITSNYREKLVEELKAAGRAEGIPLREKPRPLLPTDIKISKDQRIKHKGNKKEMQQAYQLKSQALETENEIIKKLKEKKKDGTVI